MSKKHEINSADFKRMKIRSSTRKTVISTLIDGSKTFTEIFEQVKNDIRTHKTLSNALKGLVRDALVEKPSRNAPYSITNRGFSWLEMTRPKPLDHLQVEVVREGPFVGSLILHLPQQLGKQFAERLYHPRPLQSLAWVMKVALLYWVNKYSQVDTDVVRLRAYGETINQNGISELWICEIPPGYPNIRKAMRENKLSGPLIECAYMALEERLKEIVS